MVLVQKVEFYKEKYFNMLDQGAKITGGMISAMSASEDGILPSTHHMKVLDGKNSEILCESLVQGCFMKGHGAKVERVPPLRRINHSRKGKVFQEPVGRRVDICTGSVALTRDSSAFLSWQLDICLM
ncbi:hypothetical protein INR49_013302 [Caranx melampygus]|nr:hypothetical protein INR49_013302 [Caranx melampygus]